MKALYGCCRFTEGLEMNVDERSIFQQYGEFLDDSMFFGRLAGPCFLCFHDASFPRNLIGYVINP